MKKSLLDSVWDQYTSLPPVATADLTGKTVVVTGANVGLGFEAAKHFARMNPGKLILACRSEDKGKAAVGTQKSRQRLGFNAIELRLLDLAKLSSVIAFADRYEKEGGRLDVLIANAAIIAEEYRLTSDGWEESHIGFERYMETKLLVVFFIRSFAELLEKTPVIINSVNPGLCDSEIGRERSGVAALMAWIMKIVLARTTEQGARQLVYAALGNPENPEALRGQYLNIHKVDEPSDYVLGDVGKARQDKLWNDLVRELSKVDPRVGEIVGQYK